MPRLYREARGRAEYRRSLDLLDRVKTAVPAHRHEGGLMLGIGETIDELFDVLADLRAIGCDVLTLGQYLAPTLKQASRWRGTCRRRSSTSSRRRRGCWASGRWWPGRSCGRVTTPTRW